MASVYSLDQDMRNLRMARYTPQATNEVRSWIEDTLGEKLAGRDLLEGLKDGVALCKLANLAVPSPGVRFKKSSMPFIQMENISHFLRACELPPLNLPAHDRFLTVDLYESKDPAQVLQCLGAFSRVANSVNPSRFPTTIGPRKGGPLSPAISGAVATNGGYGVNRNASYTSSTSSNYSSAKPNAAVPSARAMSPALTGGSSGSHGTDGGPLSPRGPVSSWSKRSDEGVTAPAWNIHQYGYMGGASQGNQGVSFGARRQITSAAPQVPSLAEKERKRKEKEVEEERLRVQAEEAGRIQKRERDVEEERERADEERRWEEETRRMREDERRRIEQQKKQWAEEERRWKEDEEARLKEEKAEAERMQAQSHGDGGGNDTRLRGQFLSQYQAEEASRATLDGQKDTPESNRVKELERQLEEARQREHQYQIERQERLRLENNRSHPQMPKSEPESEHRPLSAKGSETSWAPDERESSRQQGQSNQSTAAPTLVELGSARPLPNPTSKPTTAPAPTPASSLPLRLLPEPTTVPSAPLDKVVPVTPSGVLPVTTSSSIQSTSSRALPNPVDYTPAPPQPNRTDRFLASNPAPKPPRTSAHQPAEMGFTSTLENQQDTERRLASQQKTKAGGWASKSLLEREMERERERQKEWEARQAETKTAARDLKEGAGEGQSWDVNQYGWAGGDSQNRGSSVGSGIGIGGRRQIIGPRPRP
ncbi:calponin [Elasticomyces elasticus]|nr:calponin [Elasticomyces elasticus]